MNKLINKKKINKKMRGKKDCIKIYSHLLCFITNIYHSPSPPHTTTTNIHHHIPPSHTHTHTHTQSPPKTHTSLHPNYHTPPQKKITLTTIHHTYTYLNTRCTLCLMCSTVVLPFRGTSTRCTPNSLAKAVTSLWLLSPNTATFSRFSPGASHSLLSVLLE